MQRRVALVAVDAQWRDPNGTFFSFSYGIDQGTWQAVTPMTRAGQRYFVGFFVRRAGLPPTVRRDDSIAAALARDPALARAYGPAVEHRCEGAVSVLH